jgi:D-beta-D-heptose 7-phosphate kinase/D-beta-D-heptose 1-phosphate adenosyltransferase
MPLTSLQEAEALRRRWREEGARVVFTNGCFDLLHPGHAAYLDDARSLGDVLIVGLNNDDSIRRLKGARRPINGLQDRAAMLSALRSVDLVVPFGDDTPQQLIATLLPDVLVKGGDYEPDAIVGAREVREHGGEVVVVQFLEGYSSTELIDRIVRIHVAEHGEGDA